MSLKKLNSAGNKRELIQKQEARKLLENPLLNQDVWHTVNDLGLKIYAHQRYLTLNFSKFSQDWLKLLVKTYILVKTRREISISYITQCLSCLRKFSLFLEKTSIRQPEQINHQVFEAFDYHLHSQQLKEETIKFYYTSLIDFFNTCRLEGWLDINTYWFQGKRQKAFPKNEEINYLPEEVWNQLDQNLHYLPEPLQRMVLIIRTTGIRVGELCNLPFTCLKKQGEQWRLCLKTEKYNTKDELPIPVELVAVIQEQQEYIRQQFNDSYDNLFCANKNSFRKGGQFQENPHEKMPFSPKPKIMGGYSFNRWLNRLARECNICSKDGKLWHFQSHQFRRTVATIMTNAGVRDLIIQKYLRHRSPLMQRYYKHLLKQVLQDEYEELMKEKKYVDNTGQIVAAHQPKNPITEFLRHRMAQITTTYGECHRPILKAPCQTVNACWRCEYWRTSPDDLIYLKDDLKRIEEELEIADKLGMIRQQQGLEEDRNNLVIRLQGLEQVNG